MESVIFSFDLIWICIHLLKECHLLLWMVVAIVCVVKLCCLFLYLCVLDQNQEVTDGDGTAAFLGRPITGALEESPNGALPAEERMVVDSGTLGVNLL